MAKSNGNMNFTPNVVSVRYFKTSADISTGLAYDLYKLNSTYVKIFDYDDGLTVIFKANRTNSKKVFLSIDGVTKDSVRRDIELLDKEKKSLENATILVDELYMCVYNYSLDKFVLLSATERGGMQSFSTLNELKLSNTIRDGVMAITLGQDYEGDGKAAFYRVMINPPVPTATLQPIAVQNGLYIVEVKTAVNTTITELEQINVSNVNRLGNLEDSLGFVNRTYAAIQTAYTALYNGATGYAKTLLGMIQFLHNFVNTIYPTRNTEINTRFSSDEATIYEIIGKDPNNVSKVGTKTKLDLHATADKAIELDHVVQIDFLDDVTGSLTAFTGKNPLYNVSLSVKNDSHVHIAETSLQGKRNVVGAVNENLQTVLNDKASTTTTNTFTQQQTFNNGIKNTVYTSMASAMVLDNLNNSANSTVVFKVKDAANIDTVLTVSGTGISFSKGTSNYNLTFASDRATFGGSVSYVEMSNLAVTNSVSSATNTSGSYYLTGKNTRILANGDGYEFRGHNGSPIAYLLPTTFNLFSSNGNSLNLKANDTEILFDSTSGVTSYTFTKASVFSSSLTANAIYAPTIKVKKSTLEYGATIESDYVSYTSSAGLNYYLYDKKVQFPTIQVGGTAAVPGVTIQTNSQVEFVAGTGMTRFYMTKDLYVVGEVSCSSDIRLKSNINSLDKKEVLEKVSKLAAYSYLFKDSEDLTIGVIADEIETEFPELVRTNTDGYKTVNYNGLSALALASVGELNKELKDLRAKVNGIEAIVNQLRTLGG